MNKKNMFIILLIFISMAIFSQGIYFDIGLGVGPVSTILNETNVSTLFSDSVEEVGTELGAKIGYGPFYDIPVYFVLEFDAVAHRFEDSIGFSQYNSYLIGPGIVFYPLSFLQIGTSGGYSFIANSTSVEGVVVDEGKGGVAASVSLAMDFGDKYNGVLIGCKTTASYNFLTVTEGEMISAIISFFVRYSHR